MQALQSDEWTENFQPLRVIYVVLPVVLDVKAFHTGEERQELVAYMH
jgi:hypothetical protein